MTANEPVRLGDIAAIDSPDAERLGEIIVAPDVRALTEGRAWGAIEIDTVRALVREHSAGEGRLAINGDRCVIRVVGEGRNLGAGRMGEKSHEKTREKRRAAVVDITGPAVVRTLIVRQLSTFLSVEPDQMRLLFDERDEDFLERIERGRRVVVQPMTAPTSAVLNVEVRIYAGARLLEKRAVRVHGELFRTVVVLRRELSRDEAITEENAVVEDRWVPFGGRIPAGKEAVFGSVVRKRMRTGTVVHAGDTQPPVLVKRGQIVNVRCLSGLLEIHTQARARANGRLGEMVECRIDGSKRSFTALVGGAGLVTVSMNALQ